MRRVISNEKKFAFSWVDKNRKNLSDWHQLIWNYAEPAWREYKSAAWYVKHLRKEGFDVEEKSGGMPTAFVASWKKGEGPTIGAYAEYDAVPGNCQAAVPFQSPRDGLSRFAPGHTDPHSALGMGSLGGILALQKTMKEFNIEGSIRFFGEPAEKVQGSKPIHAQKGYYDDIDAMFSFHPFYMLPLCNTTRWETHCGAYYNRIYTFLCEEPQTWLSSTDDSPIAASHSVARAPGANAALFQMYSLTKTTQESMLSHSGNWSMNEAIWTQGQATADNLPARITQIQYSWRTPTIEMADTVLSVLDQNAKHAADATHCQLEKGWITKTRPGIANLAFSELTYKNLELVGAPKYDKEAVNIAREIQSNLGLNPMDSPFLDACQQLMPPQEAETLLRKEMPPWQKNWTSDDYVEMTWHTPTVRLYIARPTLKIPENNQGYPGWVSNALGGIRSCIDPTIITAAKTISATALDLLIQPAELEKIKEEFSKRSGGKNWIPSLLPPDFQAPVDYAWPEYVTTSRGEEWPV